MIQIILKDKTLIEDDFLQDVGKEIYSRLSCLRISLDHIRDINLSTEEPNFTGYKSTTEDLINLVIKPSLPNSDFNKEVYVPAVRKYLAQSNRISDAAIDIAVKFVDDMLLAKGKQLDELLLCPPDQLWDMNEKLVAKYKIASGMAHKIIKLAFDYPGCEKITAAIKSFFYSQNIVATCPYCNIGDTTYVSTKENDPAAIHELDHFFGKANHPLLCYSFYNLIPADGNCNGQVNKGSIKFDRDYYLNPHSGGFGSALRFQPIIVGTEIDEIKLHISGGPGDRLFNQMVGNLGKIDQTSNKGNINVFKLEAKYNKLQLRITASKVAQAINKRAAGRRSIISFLKRLGKNNTLNAHKQWYEDEIRTAFDEKRFNDIPLSKLYRDIHDDVFEKDAHPFNKDIRNIIAKRYH